MLLIVPGKTDTQNVQILFLLQAFFFYPDGSDLYFMMVL